MKHTTKQVMQNQVVTGYREYGISMALFRNNIGQKIGLNITDMECLDVLFFKGVATPTELAKYTGLSTGATTTMLDRLERSGLVARKPNPKDRRGTLIVIVEEAAQKIAPLFASVRQAQDELLSGYSEKELELLRNYFQKSTQMWENERQKLLSSDS